VKKQLNLNHFSWINEQIKQARLEIKLIKKKILRTTRIPQPSLANTLEIIKWKYGYVIRASKSSSWKQHCKIQRKLTI